MSDQPTSTGVPTDFSQVFDPSKANIPLTKVKESYTFPFIPRKDYGTLGRPIHIRANHFQVDIPDMNVFHYEVFIIPDDCPRRLNRAIFQEMVNTAFATTLSWQLTVFDGRKNMFSREWLPLFTDAMSVEVELPGSGSKRLFEVVIKYKGEINLRLLSHALCGIGDIPKDGMYAVDTILRQLSSMRMTPVGRSFFQSPSQSGQYPLGGGREVWFGYHQSVKPSNWKLTLNIDVSATAFYKEQSVLDLLCEVLGLRDISDQTRALTEQQRHRFGREINGLKVEVNHAGEKRRKYRVRDVTKRTAHTQSFPLKTEAGHHVDCRVSKYFSDKYSKVLLYPFLPCLQAGPDSKHIFLPLEVCNIVPGQRCKKKLSETQTSSMIRSTAKTAPEREKQINKLVSSTNFMADPYLKTFGVMVDAHMTDIQGRVMPSPKIQYGDHGRSLAIPHQGVWDMRGKKFKHAADLKVWAALCFSPKETVTQNNIISFLQQLTKSARDVGMDFAEQPKYFAYMDDIGQVATVFKYLKEMFENLKLIIVVLPGKTPVYAEVKRVGDLYCGIATQCVQAKNVQRTSAQTMSNLCLKINTKLGGINNILLESSKPSNVFEKPVIFIGIDITHPPGGDTSKPSIAAVVGSIDGYPYRYSASVRAQPAGKEVIDDIASMVRDVLVKFYHKTQFRPYRIIVYRNGVSDGQLAKVLNYELSAIRQACLETEDDYRPGITFIVVQRRHHTRLFCADGRERVSKSGNVPAGTTIDTDITHPTQFDFFLCSHAGIQGTSRPSYYHVLWDDNDFSADDLQQLTYQLCHTYSRCTRSVSIPAPAYYAHLTAFRARYHLDKEPGSYLFDGAEDILDPSDVSMKEMLAVHEDMDAMYFT